MAFFETKAEREDLSIAELDVRLAIKGDLMNLYIMEERNIIQKSKLNWLKLGDENTSFFHRYLSTKKRKNIITELVSNYWLICNPTVS